MPSEASSAPESEGLRGTRHRVLDPAATWGRPCAASPRLQEASSRTTRPG
jgi:hypothetical protein